MIKQEDILKIHKLLIDQFGGSHRLRDEPSHDKNFDTHADVYDSQQGKTCSQSIVGKLHLTELIKL